MLIQVQYVFVISILCGLLASLLHRVEHGHVCLYFRGGYLLSAIAGPGVHIRLPILTQTLYLPIAPKTDIISKVDCTTSDGVRLLFEHVQVVYSFMAEEILQTLRDTAHATNPVEDLIRRPLRRALQQFCEKRQYDQVYHDDFQKIPANLKYRITKTSEQTSSNTATLSSYFQNVERVSRVQERPNEAVYTFQSTRSGIRVHEIHVTRPKVPDSKLSRQLEQRVVDRLAILDRLRIDSQKNEAAVEKARTDNIITEMNGQQRELDKARALKIAEIQNLLDAQRQKSKADAEAYRRFTLAEANRALFTEAYFKNLQAITHKPVETADAGVEKSDEMLPPSPTTLPMQARTEQSS